MHLAIYGAGAWGTALAIATAPRHRVTLMARSADAAGRIAASRVNQAYLPGHRLPESVAVLPVTAAALAAVDLIVIATPVAGLRAALATLSDLLGAALDGPAATPVVWLCKGCEEATHLLPHQIAAEVAPGAATGVFAGPSFAGEVALGRPTAMTVASRFPTVLERTSAAFHGASLRVYTSDDVVGVEVGGAVKNVMAIATGISDGLGLGPNTRAALMTRGLSEMMRLGAALGGRAETFMGLTVVGDLILTCTGELSRNRRVGIGLGEGRALADVLAGLGHVAEGTRAALSVRALALAHGVEMPISRAVCAVLFEGLAPADAVTQLLGRAPKDEF